MQVYQRNTSGTLRIKGVGKKVNPSDYAGFKFVCTAQPSVHGKYVPTTVTRFDVPKEK